MKKIISSVVTSLLLASSLSAISFNQDSLKITFEGYKTEYMEGVAGEFKDVKYDFSKNTQNLGTYLKGAKAVIKPASAFMGEGNDLITHNITKVFFPHFLGNSNIEVLFEEVYLGNEKGVISAKVTMDKTSTSIPLTYTIENNKFVATGQLGLHIFKNSSKALEALAEAAPGHGGISWPLVDLTFSADVIQ